MVSLFFFPFWYLAEETYARAEGDNEAPVGAEATTKSRAMSRAAANEATRTNTANRTAANYGYGIDAPSECLLFVGQ